MVGTDIGHGMSYVGPRNKRELAYVTLQKKPFGEL